MVAGKKQERNGPSSRRVYIAYMIVGESSASPVGG